MRSINLVDVDLNRDIQEISRYIQSYVDSTYLSQIRDQVTTYKRESEETPFPEVQLLQAMVPFVPEGSRGQFSNVIKMITYSIMVENMLPTYGVESFFTRTGVKEKMPNDYIHEAIIALVLYKTIVWAEESDII